MDRVVIKLDLKTSERARRLARAHGMTVKALVQHVIAQLDHRTSSPDLLLGLFADEPALIDQVVDQALQFREMRPLRRTDS